MLVDRDAVEAELRGHFKLVEVAIVKLVALLRIKIGIRQHHPRGAVFLRIAHVQLGIRHQVEHEDFHGATLWMNCDTWSAKTCGCSMCARWAQPGRVATVAPAIRPFSAS